MFKKNNNRKRIAIGTTAVIIIVVVIVVVVVVSVPKNKDKNDSTQSAPVIQDEVYDLAKFMSVASSGLANNQVNVTVRFTGNENCNHAWTYGHLLSNTLTFEDNIPDLSNYTFTLTSIDKEPNTNNSRVKLRMNSTVNVTDGSVDINFYFDGLNTTATPFTVFEEVYIPTGLENSSLRIDELPLDNGVAQGNIIIASRIAQYGGILTPSTRKRINDGFIKSIEQGISIYLETSETNEVIPSPRFGIFRKSEDSETYKIYKDSHSFNCFIMGNPVPTVEIMLKYPNGSMAEFQPIQSLRELYTYHDILTVEKSQLPNGGTFICRATSNGQIQTREVTFEFREPQSCTPNSTLTGVITQTSDNDVVQCTAHGDPRPELEITLYYYSGPDLTKYDSFQTSRAFLDDTTVTANLTIAPPNPDIHTVFCVCKQQMFSSSTGPDNYQSIVLYPGRQNNETLFTEILNKVYPPF